MIETQSNLYGALTNPRQSDDLRVSLELPPIDLAPVSFDFTRDSGLAREKVSLSPFCTITGNIEQSLNCCRMLYSY